MFDALPIVLAIALRTNSFLPIPIAPTHLATNHNSVTLAWDASPSPSVVGYKIYYGTNGIAEIPVDVGNVTRATLTGLPPDPLYYAATAYDANGLESDFSNVAATLGWKTKSHFYSQTNASPVGVFTDHRYLFTETNATVPEMNYKLRIQRETERIVLP